MSEFFSKIVDNKSKLLIGLGGVALVGALAYFYKSYSQQENQIAEQVHQDNYNVDDQINKLLSEIDINNPSLEDVKRILLFSLEATKKQIFKFSKSFKNDRKKYTREKRNQNLNQYLRMIMKGMIQIQQVGQNSQQQIMMKIGVTQQVFARYQNQLGAFMQQQMMKGVAGTGQKQLSIDQVRNALNLQINFINNHGLEMVERVVQTCSSWNQQDKAAVETLVSVYMADQVFQEHPDINQDDLQSSTMKYQNQLMNQIGRLQQSMGPIMQALYQGLGLMNEMGGMGGMGQQMPTMEQLQVLQAQDPEAFEQYMAYMQMQMQGGR